MANSIAVGVDAAASKAVRRTSDPTQEDARYLSVDKLRQQYTDYLHVKQPEITEQRQARHYYHGDQWTTDEIAVLRARKQPVTTKNRTARKINAVIGIIERMRQDPKAFPRTPQHAEGAEVATAVVRYILDNNRWETLSNDAGLDGAVDGIGGVELVITTEEQGDPDIKFEVVDPDTFFYDPRSFKEDFSDARYMGVAKWVDAEMAKELLPEERWDDIDNLVGGGGSEMGADTDREKKWVDSDNKRLRLVDQWYVKNGKWHWCVYSWDVKFMEGESPFIDENGDTFCKFIMYSASVDHDGDRYGFVRNMKSMQDEINHRTSRALFYLNSRGVVLEEGGVADVEALRKELARPDFVVVKQPGLELELDDQRRLADIQGQLKFLEMGIQEFENFGPNPALVGEGGVENSSGRAISLLQQAGIQELGPFMIANRGWKLRVYRAAFNCAQRFWKAERWIRVTDDEGVAQHVQLNGVGIDPNTGMPVTVNSLGALDVDIILDEGPDTLTMEADTFESLRALGPAFAERFPDIALELMPGIQQSVKKKLQERMQQQQAQPNPEVAAKQAELQLKQQEAEISQQTTIAKVQSDIQLAREKAASEIELKRISTEADIELERKRAEAKMEVERATAGVQLAVMKEKTEGEMGLKAQSKQLEFDLADRADQREAAKEERENAKHGDRDQAIKTTVASLQKIASSLDGVIARMDDIEEQANAPVELITDPKTRKIARVRKGKREVAINRI